MSSSEVLPKAGAMLRIVMCFTAGVSVLVSSGCAYFHPAFITNPSRASAATERGMLVCERLSLTRSDCSVVSHSEVNRMLSEISGRY